MKQTYGLFVIFILFAVTWGRPRFLAIPLENVQLVELSDQQKTDRLSLIRVPRQITINKPTKRAEYFQRQPQPEASSYFEQANFNPHEYVDYGAHTGHHGSFGWYADFPVQKD